MNECIEKLILDSNYGDSKVIIYISKCILSNKPIPSAYTIAKDLKIDRTTVWRWLKAHENTLQRSCNEPATSTSLKDSDLSQPLQRTCNEPATKETKKNERFKKPTIDEIDAYCEKKGVKIDAVTFWHHYESNGWLVGKGKMKSWHSAVRTWERSPLNRPVMADKRTIEERKAAFIDSLRPFVKQYGKDMMNEFYRKWSQPLTNNPNLMRWEGEVAWELSTRIKEHSTWANNNK